LRGNFFVLSLLMEIQRNAPWFCLATAGDAEMIEHAERATVSRDRAEELRTIAPGLGNHTSRAIFLRLAENYDNLADIQDQLAALKR
jgi:hypothetical protein